ncbi:hypothetical protein CDO87_03515 [Sagittula sp. P11]|uniref:DUF7146 domain-containing protein n=1 Tax=Sagittula sp. P11 TaxID=2009329 RepID=UPI000C2D2D91|nr:toprim domain-containing protein [Sagittula sp. P11]AUC52312.1 hypothetical protein CDO87_03515 [Sagittula sp. P11]
MSRATYSLDEIKSMLLGQLEGVVNYYAPPGPGTYRDKGEYWTLNPGRADRHVGSFKVTMIGVNAGRWKDFATGSSGDLIDLIDLALHGEGRKDLSAAIKEARSFLGLGAKDPGRERMLREAAERAAKARKQAEQDAAEKEEKRRRTAHRIFLSGQERLRGTPVEAYLRDARGIDLAALGRQPRCMRFVPECYYQHVDKETGEVIEGRWPAMVTAIHDRNGKFVAVHRTYLELHDGRWGKARVPEAKKVLGRYGGCGINVWRGIGPKGGKPVSLSMCPPRTHVYATEGIEDALSVVALLPHVRVVAAVSLDNLAQLWLPRNVSDLTIVGDNDPGEEAQEALRAGVRAHQDRGRRVRLFKNAWGGKDLNDALRSANKTKGIEGNHDTGGTRTAHTG